MKDGFVNHGSMDGVKAGDEEGWVARGRQLTDQESRIFMHLKSLSTLNKEMWIKLALLYKERQDFARAEIAYIGARYCDFDDQDLMRDWLGVMQMNRGLTMTKRDMLREANACNQGLADVLNGPQERVMKELQMLLFFMEREEVIDVGEGEGSIVAFAGGGGSSAMDDFEKMHGKG